MNINTIRLTRSGGIDMTHHHTLTTVAILNPATPKDGSGRAA